MSQSANLETLNRREFLAAAGAGVGVALLGPAWTLAETGGGPEFSFAIVSDTHIGYRRWKPRRGAARLWEQTAAEIAKADADFVLHLGDVVDAMQEDQYPVYKEIRDTTKKRFYEVPGNHDPQELFARHIRKPVDTSFDHKGIRFVLFNNTKTTSHEGFVTDRQMGWLDGQCAQAARKGLAVVLCAHVPFHPNKHPDRGWFAGPKGGQKGFADLLKRHERRILAVMSGHFHNGLRGWSDRHDVEEIIVPSALYNLDRKLQGRAPGYNLQEFRPGYVLARIKAGTMTLRYKPTGKAAQVSKTYQLKKLRTCRPTSTSPADRAL